MVYLLLVGAMPVIFIKRGQFPDNDAGQLQYQAIHLYRKINTKHFIYNQEKDTNQFEEPLNY